jgi:two-component system chemotaxis response regulator CheB
MTVPGPGSPPDGATPASRSNHGVVVIAASAGGIGPLGEILSELPADFPLPIAVVLHRRPTPPNLLPQVLGRRTKLHVKAADAGETLKGGTVYVAPPDLHLTVEPDSSLAFRDGTRIRHLRSSANPLFTTAAEKFDGNVIAVVLSGSGRDATDGVQSVKTAGGVVIVQDPEACAHPGMPRTAIATGSVDHVLPVAAIAPALIDLATHARN